MKYPYGVLAGLIMISVSFELLHACASGSSGDEALNPNNGSGKAGTSGGLPGGSAGDLTGTGTTVAPAYTPNPKAFPADPIFDTEGGKFVPLDAAGLFGGVTQRSQSGGGPCLLEPQVGATPETGSLFPNNWLRPRFRLQPAEGQTLFELRFEAPGQEHPLIIYTMDATWTMPKFLWDIMASGVQDVPIRISVWGAPYNGGALTGPPVLGTTGVFTIARAAAAGTIVYWRTIPNSPLNPRDGSGELKGFKVGDESVVVALQSPQVQQTIDGLTASPAEGPGKFTCIGCHTSTPDGEFIGVTVENNQGANRFPNGLASARPDSVGQTPSFLTPAAITAMGPDSGPMTYSKAHWKTGDRIQVGRRNVDGFTTSQLVWIDLEAKEEGRGKAFDVLLRDQDSRGVWAPTWSHDGKRIAYTSTIATTIGTVVDSQGADIFAIDYNDRKGGPAAPIAGAARPDRSEYHPAFSPDDKWIAFTTADASTQNLYNQSTAEVHLVSAAGGEDIRLTANDKAACGAAPSPGAFTNSWPKWSPEATVVGNKTYYWVTFSSQRTGDAISQLYVAGIVVEGGKVTTYPALYFWNQPANESNHTPAWDVFQIPPVPVNLR